MGSEKKEKLTGKKNEAELKAAGKMDKMTDGAAEENLVTRQDGLEPENQVLVDTLLFQFDIACQMLDFHLHDLDNGTCLWRPGGRGLHVTENQGVWSADWPENEEYGMGASSIAWITWHILFWWSMVFDYSFGSGTLTKEAVTWPGSAQAVKGEIELMEDKWRSLLTTLTDEELKDSSRTKWPFENRPFYELAAWLNLELMKNAAEIGYCRFMRASLDHK
ncbi:DinB family protein [Anoxybacterium hadale]